MPEMPDVAAFRKYFETYALKRKIASAGVRNPKIVRGLTAKELEKELAGDRFLSSRQHGKYLFAELDSGRWLLMHFGMTGFLDAFDSPGSEPEYTRLSIAFEDGGFLAYVNARMLGWIGITGDPEEFIKSRDLGPSALDPSLDFESFKKRLPARGEIKPALMNQRIIAGIGNIYSDEILFHAGVHPKTKVGSISEERLRVVFEKMKEVLQTAIDLDADPARFPENHLLRGRRKGATCPVCGTRLETAKFSGRTAYFCPRCQQVS